jgi:hypothetical protein
VLSVVVVGAGAFAAGVLLPAWHPNQVVLVLSVFALLALWWSRLLPATVLGAGIGLLCSLGTGTALRITDVILGAAVATAVEWRFRLTAAAFHAVRAGKVAPPRSFRIPIGRLPPVIHATVTGPGEGVGLTAAERNTLLREGQVLLGFVGGALYGAAWLAAQWFYGSLGVSPEEVGLGAVDLMLIAGVVAVLIAGLVILLDTLWRRVRHPALRLPAFALLGAVIGALLAGWPVALLYALAGAGLAAVTASYDDARPVRSGHWIAVAASAVLLALGVTSYAMSGVYRDRVTAGKPVTPGLAGFQIAVLWAPTVRVFPLDGEDLPPGLSQGACVHRLGNSDGVTVFFTAENVFRVPAEAVLSRTCEGA